MERMENRRYRSSIFLNPFVLHQITKYEVSMNYAIKNEIKNVIRSSLMSNHPNSKLHGMKLFVYMTNTK